MSDPLIAAMGNPPKLPNLRQSRPASRVSAPPSPAPAPEQRTAPPQDRDDELRQQQRPRARAARKAAGGRPATGRSSVAIGLPVPLVEPMANAAAKTRQSYGDWLMSMLNDVWDELDDVYPPLPKVRPELPPPRRTPRGQVAGGRQAVNFRLTDEQLAAIEKRREQLQVESRSEFVSTVVELALRRG